MSSASTDLVLWMVWTLVTVAALLLPAYLGATFLLVRNCHPSINLSLEPGFISGFDLSNTISSLTSSSSAPPNPEVSDNETVTDIAREQPASFLENIILGFSNLTLRPGDGDVTVQAPVIPKHLLRSASGLVTPVLDQYSLNDVTNYCIVNDLGDQPGLLSLGLGVCNEALIEVLGEDDSNQLNTWISDLKPGTESGLVSSVIAGDLVTALGYLPDLFPKAGTGTFLSTCDGCQKCNSLLQICCQIQKYLAFYIFKL